MASAIIAQDPRVLARATGVGARLAERIILELKDKVSEESFQRRILSATPVRKITAPADELVDALLALGYRRTEAEGAAEQARGSATTVEDQLKAAIQVLRK